jgi:hypothetical protein
LHKSPQAAPKATPSFGYSELPWDAWNEIHQRNLWPHGGSV